MKHKHPYPANALAPLGLEVTEVTLLLPVHEVVRLEAAARARGMTAGQFLRRLVRQALRRHPGRGAPAEALGAYD
jgi:hypothetical protein